MQEQLLSAQQARLEQFKKFVREKQDQADKTTQGMLDRVNSYIESYAVKQGYTVVMGVTTSGNILYGSKEADITEDIIQGLNGSFSVQ